MRSLYAELAIAHAIENKGHRVATSVDGTEKAVHVFHGTLPVTKLACDQCHATFPKPLAFRWEDLVLCPACG
jgi:NAD-dependent SIR2 family protein deacetylase